MFWKQSTDTEWDRNELFMEREMRDRIVALVFKHHLPWTDDKPVKFVRNIRTSLFGVPNMCLDLMLDTTGHTSISIGFRSLFACCPVEKPDTVKIWIVNWVRYGNTADAIGSIMSGYPIQRELDPRNVQAQFVTDLDKWTNEFHENEFLLSLIQAIY